MVGCLGRKSTHDSLVLRRKQPKQEARVSVATTNVGGLSVRSADSYCQPDSREVLNIPLGTTKARNAQPAR